MSQILSFILTVSWVALTGCLVYRMIARRQIRRLPSVLVLGLVLAVVMIIVPARVDARGEIDEIAAVVICYLSMVAGMMAEIGFARAERRDAAAKFDLMTFMLPVFASPIVFIPLLTLMTDEVMAGGAFRRANLMVYFVAFQNGFFWKSFFERRRAEYRAPSAVEHEQRVMV